MPAGAIKPHFGIVDSKGPGLSLIGRSIGTAPLANSWLMTVPYGPKVLPMSAAKPSFDWIYAS